TITIAEDTLPPEHPARLLWTALGDFDLSAFVDEPKAVQGVQGRPFYSPRMLLTLWGYALWDGVVHARHLARKCKTDLPYRWIVGDLNVEKTKLAQFRAAHLPALVTLLADVLGALLHADLLFLPSHSLAQDGTRVAASASTASFRSALGLDRCRQQAELH